MGKWTSTERKQYYLEEDKEIVWMILANRIIWTANKSNVFSKKLGRWSKKSIRNRWDKYIRGEPNYLFCLVNDLGFGEEEYSFLLA